MNKSTRVRAAKGAIPDNAEEGRRVFALTKYDTKGASSRVRFLNLIPSLTALGWQVEHFPLMSNGLLMSFYERRKHNYPAIAVSYASRLRNLWLRRPPDLWWVEKELLYGFPLMLERLLLSVAGRGVIDYDDAVFLNYEDTSLGRWGRAEKFTYYARNAAYLTVGSEFLRVQMERRGAQRIRKIPSTIEVAKYKLHWHQAEGPIVIGWIGTPVTVRFLDLLKGVLPALAQRFQIRMHVIGARWECAGVEVRCCPWTLETEALAIAQFDIGVMPLVDGEWERGKCAYKLIQYMAAGAVPFGSRVGENAFVIEDGINGFLASDAEEWIEKLVMLCGDAKLRSALGERARQIALENYDVRFAANAVHEVFTEVVSRRNRGAL